MRPLFLLLLLFFLLPSSGFSQTPNEFHIQQFNTENGLPSNGIKGLQWDEQTGFLWIGTEAGVVRYNGMEFKVLGKEDNPNLTNERILFMVKNNAGKIFTTDYAGNVFYIEKNKLVFVGKNQLFNNPKNNIVSIAVSEILYRSQVDFSKGGPQNWQYSRPMPLGDTAVYTVYESALYHYSITSDPSRVSPASMALSAGFKIGDNFFVRDGQKSVYLFDRFSNRFSPVSVVDESNGAGLDDPLNLFVWEIGRSHPLLFNKGKVWTLGYSEGKLKARLICDKVPENTLVNFAFYNEKRKTLFIGTDSKGMIIITANKMESLRAESHGSYQRTSYYAQVELPGGNVLTNEGHIVGKNTAAIKTLPIERKFSNSIFLSGDSLLWFWQPNTKLGYGCLHHYNYHTGQTKPFEKIPAGTESVMAVSGGKFYLADDRGIFLIAGDTIQQLYQYSQDAYSRIHYDMKEIEPGVLAIANCNYLLRFDIAVRKLDTIFNSGNYCVRTIWQYEDNIFFGTYGGGLFVYKKGKVKSLPLDKNKYLLYTHCFVKDDAGYCWISTNKGLFKTSLSELVKSFDNDTSSLYYYYFGRNDGMDMTELNGGCTPCALLKKDKTISFPSMDGLLWVDPENALPDLPEGDIYIDQFSVDGKLINPDSVSLTELPEQTTEIIIKLGLSAWCNKENIYLDYRLADNDVWKPVNIDGGIEIRFYNLRQGDYQLQIRKRNGFSQNDYSYSGVAFHINVPWYKQWWFYVLIGLSALGLVALYLRIRTRQYKIRQRKLEQQVSEKTKELLQKNAVLEKNDTIKTRLISIISHDIITPLKFVTVAGKNLLEKKHLMSGDLQQETIKEITNTSQELQLLSTNILNWIKYQNENRRMAKETFNVHEMVNQVLGILQSLARQKGNIVENKVEASVAIHQFYEPLKILIYNLLTNAIHFTEKGTISVDALKVNEHTTIVVTDEGIGMTPEQIQRILADEVVITSVNVDNKKGHGLGYLIIKDLLKTMGATISISSEKGRGTAVSIHIPNGVNK